MPPRNPLQGIGLGYIPTSLVLRFQQVEVRNPHVPRSGGTHDLDFTANARNTGIARAAGLPWRASGVTRKHPENPPVERRDHDAMGLNQ